MQLHVHPSCSAGLPSIVTFVQPGDQGATVAGMQGCGVSTPLAADVADATCGFDVVVHMPKGLMLTDGAKSMMVAAGWLSPSVVTGTTDNDDGAVPQEHLSVALLTTSSGM